MTVAERALWSGLRTLDLNIRRQAPIGPYVADFAHHAARLVIEVDGYYHSLPENQARDAERDAWLAGQGYRTLRLSDREVLGDLAAVLQLIQATVQERLAASLRRASPPSPALPPSRGKGV
jgi:very-short-patch-repair endonuclease